MATRVTFEAKSEKFSVVIPAYQRSEKLLARIEEISVWPRLSQLVISVDGLRKSADALEQRRREEVIYRAESAGKRQNNLEILVWDENYGVNFHNLRFMKRLFPQTQKLIIIEDDVGVTNQSLDFLANNCDFEGSKGAAAHVSHTHSGIDALTARNTLFPIQWGQALAPEATEIYIAVMGGRKINRKAISTAFKKLYADSFTVLQLERLIQWWFNHFYFCMKHGNWADAVVQYSVIAAGGYFRVPAQSLVVDDSSLYDMRALTPRVPITKKIECENKAVKSESGDYECFQCETRNSHFGEAKWRNLIGATKHRRALMLKDLRER